MNKIHFFLLISIAIAIAVSVMVVKNQAEVEESITFFPIDPSVTYKKVDTNLSLLDHSKREDYDVKWRVSSALDRDAYLRQDLAFLYANGRLKGMMGEWEQNTEQVVQEEIINMKESSHFEAISFHHAEIHYDGEVDGSEKIYSAQSLSADELYVIDSSFSPLHSFREAHSKEEKEWKSVLDQITSQQLEYSWSKMMTENSINEDQYHQIPLTDIAQYKNKPFPGFTKEETNTIMGNLWEGLYKNYFLGIKKKDGSIVEPIDSTIPLILIAKNQTELLVISELKDGEAIVLRQNLSPTR
jgi:hypothetical protein